MKFLWLFLSYMVGSFIIFWLGFWAGVATEQYRATGWQALTFECIDQWIDCKEESQFPKPIEQETPL